MNTGTTNTQLEERQKKWDHYFIQMAILVSTKSKDPSTKVGCVIVSNDYSILTTGYNGFPRGVAEESAWDAFNILDREKVSDRWDKRPEKYQWVEHAERNAIFNAAREGTKLKDSIAYLNWEPAPCSDCTRALIQSGIKEIVGPDIPFGGVGVGKHYHINTIAKTMLAEAEINIRIVPWEK